MRAIRLIAISCCIIGCSQSRKAETVSNIDSVSVDSLSNTQNAHVDSGEVSGEEECVFDTSTYKFTTEALREYDKKIVFHWDKTLETASIRLNEVDSLQLHIGGCTHFSYAATFITDSSKFKNREYLLEKTKWLAKSFFSSGFDQKYVDCIERKLYRLEESTRPDFLYYTIIDLDTAVTDHVYDGWSFEKIGNRTRVSLDGYIN